MIAITAHQTHSALPGIGSRAPCGQFGPRVYCGRVSDSLGLSIVVPPRGVWREHSARRAEILRAAVAHRTVHLPRVVALLDERLTQLPLRGHAQEEPDE